MLERKTNSGSVQGFGRDAFRVIPAEVDLRSVKNFRIGRFFQREITRFSLCDKNILGYNTVYVLGRQTSPALAKIDLIVQGDSLYGIVARDKGQNYPLIPAAQFEGQIDRAFFRLLPSVGLTYVAFVAMTNPQFFQNSILAQALGLLSGTLLSTVVCGIFRWVFLQERHGTKEQLICRAKSIHQIYLNYMGRDSSSQGGSSA